MTNIMPQSAYNNQQTWKFLEMYCRTLTDAGNEVYIIAGPYGSGGTGDLGGVTTTIANGLVTVPSYTWTNAITYSHLPFLPNSLSRLNLNPTAPSKPIPTALAK